MKLHLIVTFMIIGIFSCIFAQEKLVSAKSTTGVYENQIRKMYENPIIMITPSERLIVIATKGDFYQVKTNADVIGWVEKSKVISIGKSKIFKFDNTEVVGYLDNPTPVYILDSDNPDAERIYLDRSFKDALRDNIDKETVERITKK